MRPHGTNTGVRAARNLAQPLLAVAALAMIDAGPARAASLSLSQTFVRPQAGTGDFLGQSLAIANGNLLVGVPGEDTGATDAGAVFLFEPGSGPDNGRFIRLYQAVNPADGGKCGSAVAAVGDNVLVGCPFDNTGAQDAGVVQLFDGTTAELLHTFVNPAPATSDRFGSAVASFATTVYIAAPYDGGGNGVVYAFDGDPLSPNFGDLLATIANPTPAANDVFGYAIAAVGSVLLIGAPSDDGTAAEAGAAYLFDGDPSSPGFGTLLDTLLDPAPNLFENFGWSVAAVGSQALVGAPMDSAGASFSGAAFLFDANPLSPTFGDHLRTFKKPTPVAGDQLGYSVAGSGSNVLAGALLDDTAASDGGAAYLFDAATGAVLKTYTSSSPQALENFGLSVAGAGTLNFAGAPGTDGSAVNQGAYYQFENAIPPVKRYVMPTDGGTSSVALLGTRAILGMDNDELFGNDAGAVYVYQSTGAPLRVLASPEPQFDGEVGGDIATAGGNLLVGARFDGDCCDQDENRYGRAYLFDADPGSPSFTALLATFSDPNPATQSDYFGWSVATRGTNLLIGAYSHDVPAVDTGIVYVYDGDPGSVTFGDVLDTLQHPSPAAGQRFGYDIATSGTRAVISALDAGPSSAGEAYLLDADPSSPTFGNTLCTFTNPTPETSTDNFGFRVALSPTRALIANPNDSVGTGVFNSGAAYLYDANPASPTFCSLLRTFLDPTPLSNENFGWSVAFLGTDILVGNLQEPRNTTKQGSVYLFDGESAAYKVTPSPDPSLQFFSWALTSEGTNVLVGGRAGTGYRYAAITACGDGLIDTGEQCDDSNTANGDCCSSTCQFEPLNSPCVVGGNVCYECNATGQCVAEIDHCSDANTCTTDTCNPSTGCQHANVLNGTSCNDGNTCTPSSNCQAGICTSVGCNTGSVCGLCGTMCQISGGVCGCQ